MRLFIACLFLTLIGCSSYPVKRVGIIHDYVFTNANRACKDHDGLHYIVVSETIEAKSTERYGHSDDYPCSSVHGFRCQDGTLHKFYDGIGYCFISESQLDETMQVIDPPKEVRHHEREFGRGKL